MPHRFIEAETGLDEANGTQGDIVLVELVMDVFCGLADHQNVYVYNIIRMWMHIISSEWEWNNKTI